MKQATQEKKVRDRRYKDPMRPCVWCHEPLNTQQGHAEYHPACHQEKERERQRNKKRRYYHMREMLPPKPAKRVRGIVNPMRPCRWCGAPLGTSSPHQRYHPVCFKFHRKHRSVPPPVNGVPVGEIPPMKVGGIRVPVDPERPCQWCGKPLHDTMSIRRYHKECFVQRRKQRWRKPPADPLRPCIECGRPLNDMSPIRKRHPACTEKHAREYRSRYAKLVRQGKLFPRKRSPHKKKEPVEV